MKEILLCFIVIAAVTGFLYFLTVMGNISCRKYGPDWEIRGIYTTYCVNKNGDMKGI